MSELAASDFVVSWTGQQLVLVTNSNDPHVFRILEASDLPCISRIWPGYVIPLGVDICHRPTLEKLTLVARLHLHDNHTRQIYGCLARALQDLVYSVSADDITRDVVAGSAQTWVRANKTSITPEFSVHDVMTMALNSHSIMLDSGDVEDELCRLRNPGGTL